MIDRYRVIHLFDGKQIDIEYGEYDDSRLKDIVVSRPDHSFIVEHCVYDPTTKKQTVWERLYEVNSAFIESSCF